MCKKSFKSNFISHLCIARHYMHRNSVICRRALIWRHWSRWLLSLLRINCLPPWMDFNDERTTRKFNPQWFNHINFLSIFKERIALAKRMQRSHPTLFNSRLILSEKISLFSGERWRRDSGIVEILTNLPEFLCISQASISVSKTFDILNQMNESSCGLIWNIVSCEKLLKLILKPC